MSANEAGIAQRPRFSVAINTPAYQRLINNTLADPERAKRFVAAITSSVAVNPALQECEPDTIVAGALLGESLNLSPSPQLGQYYLVPYEVKLRDKNGNIVYQTDENGENLKGGNGRWIPYTVKHAQFILGYKGYIQLAIRTRRYRRLNVTEVKVGELISYDPFNEEIDIALIKDSEAREKEETIGYYAMFEYVDGFKKNIFWSKDKMISHADKYSSAFNAAIYRKLMSNEIPDTEAWKYTGPWYKNFDAMARKTMLRQLIGHWGVMSGMEVVFERDERSAYIGDSGEILLAKTEDSEVPPQLRLGQAQPEATGEPERVNLDDL